MPCSLALPALCTLLGVGYQVLVMSEVMGMYFVSQVILMRMNMPAQYREIIAKVLGNLEFNFYYRWFDMIFLVSAVGCMAFIYLAQKYRQVGATGT